MRARSRSALACAVALASAVACGSGGTHRQSDVAPRLSILAAASLSGAFDLAADPRHGPGYPVRVSTGSSAALRVQVEQGARADVFLSADEENADALVAEGLAVGPPVTFATTHLVVIVPDADPARIHDVYDLARPGVRVVGATEAVPITRYVERAVAALAASPGAPAGYAAAVARNTLSREEDVAAVVTRVRLGEADAAIVYASLASTTDGLAVIPIPAASDVIVRYAAVVLVESDRKALASSFLAWLGSAAGADLLGRVGLDAPGRRSPAPSP